MVRKGSFYSSFFIHISGVELNIVRKIYLFHKKCIFFISSENIDVHSGLKGSCKGS